MKTVIIAALVVLLCISGAEAGSRGHKAKGAGQSKRSSVMEQQQTMNWLPAGCPPLVQPQPQVQPQPKATKKP
jgi:hypothetical protein